VGRFEELWTSSLLRIKEDAEAKAAEAHVAPAQTRAQAKKRPKKG
jgi:hypothetical protein